LKKKASDVSDVCRVVGCVDDLSEEYQKMFIKLELDKDTINKNFQVMLNVIRFHRFRMPDDEKNVPVKMNKKTHEGASEEMLKVASVYLIPA